MLDLIHESGWPIYPILALGLSCLGVAVRHALWPQRSLQPLALALGLATFLFGTLGTILGVQHSVDGLREVAPELRWIFLIGLRESLGCLVGALLCLVPAALAGGLGAHRMARRLEAIAARG